MVSVRPDVRSAARLVPLLYGVGLAYAAVGQGAQFARAFVVFLLLNLAVLVWLGRRRPAIRDLGVAAAPLVLISVLQLALWGVSTGPARLLALITVGCVGWLVGRSDQSRGVLWGVRAVGAGVAVLALLGLFTHTFPMAVERSDIWRAAGSLTYPNVTATVVGVGAMVGLSFLQERDTGWGRAVVFIQIAALVATLSRGGILAFGLVSVVLAMRSQWVRRVACELAPWLLIATGGVILAVGDGLLSGAGAAAVVMAAVVGYARGVRFVPWAWALVGGLAALVLAWLPGGLASRLSLTDGSRLTLWRRAIGAWGEHPLFGMGLGRLDLGNGPPSYAHNEYVQWLAETGLAGLVALAASAILLIRLVAAGQPASGRPLLVAAIGAIALQASVDFVLHVPLVVALLGLLLGASSRRPADAPMVIPDRVGTARRSR